jgi:DNA-binding PadR family transcriptional regulator
MGNEIPQLSGKEFVILDLLIAGGRPMYGLELVDNSGGGLPRGTVYVLLNRMEEKGYVTSARENKEPGVSGIARRLYKPTGYGVKVFRATERLRAIGRLQPAFGR